MIVEVKTRTLDGVEVSRVERTLYSLAELHEGKHIEGEDVVEYKRANAFDTACDNIARMMDESGWTQTDLETEITEYLMPEVLSKAGITTDPKYIEWDVSPTQGGMFFVLDPEHTSINARTFVRAMKGYFMGVDWRGPEYKASTEKPTFPFEKGRHKIDLRSSDARQAIEGSLVISKISRWTSEVDADPYIYEYEFSDGFRADCNDFLAEVLAFCLRTLRDQVEGRNDEQSMVELAEANEWTFTNEGAWA